MRVGVLLLIGHLVAPGRETRLSHHLAFSRESVVDSCLAVAPRESRPFGITETQSLVGSYILKLVITDEASRGRRRLPDSASYALTLQEPDTARGTQRDVPVARVGRQSSLVGTLDTLEVVFPGIPASRAEVEDSILYLYGRISIPYGDGMNVLAIERISPEGIWGRWRYHPGVMISPGPLPRGHFCARRVD
jgi:hypothetical protein